ncbi:MAG TPA: outer membrane beta-barrel protein [Gammaproteobacteria bacterium]|nr:outer membrane beta-barrel protein [Gammaproteobacteria bacterium]
MHSISTIDAPLRKRSFLKFLQIILLAGFNFLLGTSQALDFSTLKPYGGLEYVQRSLVFQEGYGQGDFNKRLPQANVFFGVQINDYLGVEAGYLFSPPVKKTSIATGRTFFGSILDQNEAIISENKINLTGPQMNVVARLPFGTSGFSAIGSLGVSYLTLKSSVKMLAHGQVIFTPSEAMQMERHFSLKKVVPKVMFGLGYQFTDSIGARILMGYEKTSQFKNISPKEESPFKVSLKNNVLCSIGLAIKF